MGIENLIRINSREELRSGLEENSKDKKSCWVIVTMSPKEDTVLYLDAVYEALCFGGIDGVKKKISENELAQRLSPRGKKSNWTELNKERVRHLEKLNLMTDEGRKVLPDMDKNSFVIDEDIMALLLKDKETYENFSNFPDVYKRIRIDTIQSVKSDQKLFSTRLEKFIKNTKENKMYGQGNDNGRLLD